MELSRWLEVVRMSNFILEATFIFPTLSVSHKPCNLNILKIVCFLKIFLIPLSFMYILSSWDKKKKKNVFTPSFKLGKEKKVLLITNS